MPAADPTPPDVPTADELAWVRSVTDAAEVTPVRVLAGSSTGSLHLLAARAADGTVSSMVVRRYDRPWVLAETPTIAAREATAVQTARQHALGPSAPTLLGLRSQGAVPLVLMSFVRGEVLLPHQVAEPRLERWLHRLAAPVANAHATLPMPAGLPAWQPWSPDDTVGVPSWTSAAAAWRVLVAVARTPPPQDPAEPAVFLHGDWHPGNCLWEREEVTGVVDWAQACIGPATVDVAHCRTNLALLHSPALADRFLQAYRRQCPGHRHHAWFDVAACVRVVGDGLPGPGLQALAAFGAPTDLATLVERADRWATHLVRHLHA